MIIKLEIKQSKTLEILINGKYKVTKWFGKSLDSLYQWFIKHIEKLYCEQCNLQLDHKQLVYSVQNSYKSHNLKHIELNTKKTIV